MGLCQIPLYLLTKPHCVCLQTGTAKLAHHIDGLVHCEVNVHELPAWDALRGNGPEIHHNACNTRKTTGFSPCYANFCKPDELPKSHWDHQFTGIQDTQRLTGSMRGAAKS